MRRSGRRGFDTRTGLLPQPFPPFPFAPLSFPFLPPSLSPFPLPSRSPFLSPSLSPFPFPFSFPLLPPSLSHTVGVRPLAPGERGAPAAAERPRTYPRIGELAVISEEVEDLALGSWLLGGVLDWEARDHGDAGSPSGRQASNMASNLRHHLIRDPGGRGAGRGWRTAHPRAVRVRAVIFCSSE